MEFTIFLQMDSTVQSSSLVTRFLEYLFSEWGKYLLYFTMKLLKYNNIYNWTSFSLQLLFLIQFRFLFVLKILIFFCRR